MPDSLHGDEISEAEKRDGVQVKSDLNRLRFRQHRNGAAEWERWRYGSELYCGSRSFRGDRQTEASGGDGQNAENELKALLRVKALLQYVRAIACLRLTACRMKSLLFCSYYFPIFRQRQDTWSHLWLGRFFQLIKRLILGSLGERATHSISACFSRYCMGRADAATMIHIDFLPS